LPGKFIANSEEENFAGLARINRELIGSLEALDAAHWLVLDGQPIRSNGEATHNSAVVHKMPMFTK
jgi:hypothetical protein